MLAGRGDETVAPPIIDGRPDDPAWREGQWAGDYIQQMPTEGAKPSQPTEIKILYDEKNVYPDTNAYDVSETGLGYLFARPDFSFREFRSNLVLHWEPKPGSSLYVVWSQGRTSQSSVWQGSLSDNYSALWNAPSQNVFLVKLSYWLPWE